MGVDDLERCSFGRSACLQLGMKQLVNFQEPDQRAIAVDSADRWTRPVLGGETSLDTSGIGDNPSFAFGKNRC